MTPAPDDLAARLLDAQVDWQMAQLGGAGLTDLIERAVDELFETGGRLRLREVVSRDELAAALRWAAGAAGDVPMVADLVAEIPVRVQASPANGNHRLSEVVARDDVEELVSAILELDRWHERTLDRLTGSPLVGVVASAFVTRLVSDVLAQNTELARKLPGMSSLLAFGGHAVGRVRGLADRQLEGALGEAMGKGGEFAVRRVNAALLAVLRTGPVRGAVLESWDLEAGEPISALAADLPPAAVRRLTESGYALIAGAAGTAYADVVIGVCAEVIIERHGDDDIADLLSAAGLGRPDLCVALDRAVRPGLDRLRDSGDLARMVRAALAPFYSTAQARRLLGQAPARPTPAAPSAGAAAPDRPARQPRTTAGKAGATSGKANSVTAGKANSATAGKADSATAGHADSAPGKTGSTGRAARTPGSRDRGASSTGRAR